MTHPHFRIFLEKSNPFSQLLIINPCLPLRITYIRRGDYNNKIVNTKQTESFFHQQCEHQNSRNII